jgi:predicted transcriptional regulator of viral defense system
MKWESLLETVADKPIFSSDHLLSGNEPARQVRLQLSHWVKDGRLIKLRRGLYTLNPKKWEGFWHPFLIANQLQPGSYVSVQSALSFYGMIPEYVPVTTSVGPGRQETLRYSSGSFWFRHITEKMLCGYLQIEVMPKQFVLMASPEKALLDLIHLTPGADCVEYLSELRLQNAEAISFPKLIELAQRMGKPKLLRASQLIGPLFKEELCGESINTI